MNRWLGLMLVLVTLGALALRLPKLDSRPMHNDEAVNAIKLQGLWEQGQYRYDPHEYHGPVLYYAALAAVWLGGARDFSQVTETLLRLAPVVFGAGLVLLLWLMADGLGRAATVFAALFTAISPAMVYYSRYFIHEMLLVFFTMLLLTAGWRYSRTRHPGWAALGGAAVGLMYATKETFVISLAALLGAGVLTSLWNRWSLSKRGPDSRSEVLRAGTPTEAEPTSSCALCAAVAGLARTCTWKHLLLAVVSAVAVALLFFTSFFTNPAGPLDALRTYQPYLHRAGGASPHIHPWYFYLERLVWFHQGRGPVWTEAAVLAFALVGFAVGGRARAASTSQTALVRFLGCYTGLLAGIYSLIPYKTPWCLLSFWHGAILLAGVGVAASLKWRTHRWLQALLGAGMVCASAHLLWQAWQTSYVLPAERRNPYAYAQTSPDLLELVEKVQALARVHPQGHGLLLKVMVPEGDYWPLPWYLRQFKQAGWWDTLPPDPTAPVMIVGARLQADLGERIEASHVLAGIYSLRPRLFLELFVEEELWQRYMAQKSKKL